MRLESILVTALALGGCSAPGPSAEPQAAEPTDEEHRDPARGEVRLAASSGWRAALALDLGELGLWAVGVVPLIPSYAVPELVALDDLGRCHVLSSYSGTWAPFTTISDGGWLGALAHGDVDPRVPGAELYVAGRRGHVYEVVPHREGPLDNRLAAVLPGREVHALVAADLDPAAPGDELLAFTRPGGLFRLTPRAELDGFDARLVSELEGRVRQAVWMPWRGELATVERSGRLRLLSFGAEGPVWRTVFERPMGMGRVAAARVDGRTVLYSTCDDGGVWRHAEGDEGEWSSALVYAGPQGPRGIAAGRFADDPQSETVAIFGYSRRVELLTRGPEGRPWKVETLFEDRDRGHWLESGELDGRNATDELVLCGYGGRVVVLARPPGYGLDVAVGD